jgi:hypothetical protein
MGWHESRGARTDAHDLIQAFNAPGQNLVLLEQGLDLCFDLPDLRFTVGE